MKNKKNSLIANKINRKNQMMIDLSNTLIGLSDLLNMSLNSNEKKICKINMI